MVVTELASQCELVSDMTAAFDISDCAALIILGDEPKTLVGGDLSTSTDDESGNLIEYSTGVFGYKGYARYLKATFNTNESAVALKVFIRHAPGTHS